MKILFIITVTALEGSTFSLFQLIKGLKDKGIQCMVIATRRGYYCDVMDEIGIPYRIIRYRNTLYPKINTFKDAILFLPMLAALSENYINFPKFKKTIAEYQPDIIHTNVSPVTIGYRAAKEFGIPHVWHIREYLDRDFHITPFPSMKSLRKKLSDSYSISITKDVKNHFALGEKNVAIYDGVYSKDCVAFQPNKKPYFLFVGFLMECKGVFDLVRAYLEYCKKKDDPYPLFMVGGYTNETYNRIYSILAGTKAEDLVILKGKQNIESVKGYMQEALCMFVPSLSEGFGRITAEAMFNGCLVAGRNTGGTKEQFDNGLSFTGKEIALRFSRNEEMTQIMMNLSIDNIQDYFPMIERGQRTASELYSIENNVNQITSFYNDILKQHEIISDK